MVSEELNRLIRQFLIHSFLYYRLDESVIPDQQYDEICRDLRDLLQQESDPKQLPFSDCLKEAAGAEGSGFAIRQYPPQIISAALHLLYQDRYRDLMSFSDFLARFGYRLERNPAPVP